MTAGILRCGIPVIAHCHEERDKSCGAHAAGYVFEGNGKHEHAVAFPCNARAMNDRLDTACRTPNKNRERKSLSRTIRMPPNIAPMIDEAKPKHFVYGAYFTRSKAQLPDEKCRR